MECRPVFRQLAQMRRLLQLTGFGLLDFVFGANGVDGFLGVYMNAFGVKLPKRRMTLDAFVQARLGDGGIVYFAVAVAAITNQIDDHIARESGAVISGDLSD